MRVAVSGASGLLGSALVASLEDDGHEPRAMVRAASDEDPGSGEIPWDVEGNRLDPDDLLGLDAVVHLAGENISSGRWSEAKKRRILESRERGTRLVAESMAAAKTASDEKESDDAPGGRSPEILVCASAIGYYGDRGDEWVDEESERGKGFLAEVVERWEAAADPAREAGLRVVHLRFGVVLSEDGGALAKMLPPFRLGLGGRLGSGDQWMSWVHLADAVGAVRHALATADLAGPVNVVAETPVRNREFVKVLGRVLGRPTIFPVPSFALKLALGEMGEELLLASTRVDGSRLRDSGYDLRHPELHGALEAELE